jgi:hypothetical protein
MPEIYPKVTRTKLTQSARKTRSGKGRASLPGVKTDAKHATPLTSAATRPIGSSPG